MPVANIKDLKSKKVKPVCDHCGESDIRVEAFVTFNVLTQTWKIMELTDNYVCNNCGQECQPKWIVIGEPNGK